MGDEPSAADAPTEGLVHPDLIEEIYEASVEPDGWQHCFDIVLRATGGVGAVFSRHTDPVDALVSPSLTDINVLYRQGWWRQDVFNQTLAAQSRLSGLLLDSRFDDIIDRSTHPFFQDFLRGHGFGRFAAYLSPRLFGSRYTLTVQRSLAAGDFSEPELANLSAMAPHACRALAISGQMSIARMRDDALLTILDRLTYGAVLVRGRGKVVAMNEAATKMLDDGLSFADGVLSEGVGNPRGTIDRLVQAGLDNADHAARYALIHRPSGRKPIVIQAIGFPRDKGGGGIQRNDTTLLMLIDTEMGGTLGQITVVQSFGLTLAEARVATLIGSGLSPSDAAEQLGSAAGTVRVQLKNVFNKLDIKRQSELVRLMAKLEVLGS